MGLSPYPAYIKLLPTKMSTSAQAGVCEKPTTRIRWENQVIASASVPPKQDEPDQHLKQDHEEISHPCAHPCERNNFKAAEKYDLDSTADQFNWSELPYSQEEIF